MILPVDILGYGIELPVIASVGLQIGCATQAFSYDSSRLVESSQPNAPASEFYTLSLSGQNFGWSSFSQTSRISNTAGETSLWISETSMLVRVAPAMSGSKDMPLAVSIHCSDVSTATGLFSFDGPQILDVWDTLPSDTMSSDVTLSGVNFGMAAYSLMGYIGTYGCTTTEWISDTSLRCRLNKGFVAGDVTLAAIEDGEVCRMCGPGETLLGCSLNSPGVCMPCSSCPQGFYRDCFEGLASSGRCLPCPNAGQEIGLRYFKNTEGNPETRCSLCSICGGSNQDGSEYESARCTRETDTQCQDCQPCADGQVRVGCAGEFVGDCATISAGVSRIQSTASGMLIAERISNTQFLTKEATHIHLKGKFRGNSLLMASETLVEFPGEPNNISITAIVPSQSMVAAQQDIELLADRVDPKNGSKWEMTMLSPVLYLGPSGVRFAPEASIYFRVLMTQKTPWSVYKWDREQAKFKQINGNSSLSSDGTTVIFNSTSFSSYVVMAPKLADPERSDSNEAGPILTQDILVMIGVFPTTFLLCCAVCLWMCWKRDVFQQVPQPSKKTPAKRMADSSALQTISGSPIQSQTKSLADGNSVRFVLMTPMGNMDLASQGAQGQTQYLTPAKSGLVNRAAMSELHSPHPANLAALSNFVLVSRVGNIELAPTQASDVIDSDGRGVKTVYLTPVKQHSKSASLVSDDHGYRHGATRQQESDASGLTDGHENTRRDLTDPPSVSESLQGKLESGHEDSFALQRKQPMSVRSPVASHDAPDLGSPVSRMPRRKSRNLTVPETFWDRSMWLKSASKSGLAPDGPGGMVGQIGQDDADVGLIRRSPDLKLPLLSPTPGVFASPARARRMQTQVPDFDEGKPSFLNPVFYGKTPAAKRESEMERALEMLSSAFADAQSQAVHARENRDAALTSGHQAREVLSQTVNNTIYTMHSNSPDSTLESTGYSNVSDEVSDHPRDDEFRLHAGQWSDGLRDDRASKVGVRAEASVSLIPSRRLSSLSDSPVQSARSAGASKPTSVGLKPESPTPHFVHPRRYRLPERPSRIPTDLAPVEGAAFETRSAVPQAPSLSSPNFVFESKNAYARETPRQFITTWNDYRAGRERSDTSSPNMMEAVESTYLQRSASFSEALVAMADDGLEVGQPSYGNDELHGDSANSRAKRWSPQFAQTRSSDNASVSTARRFVRRRSTSPPELVGETGADYRVSPSLPEMGEDACDPRSPQFSVRPGTRQFWDLD